MSINNKDFLDNYMWILGIISAIIGIIGLFTPAVYLQASGTELYLWRYGSFYSIGTYTSSGFLDSNLTGSSYTVLIAITILSMIIKIVGLIIIMITAFKAKGSFALRGRSWIIFGLLLIASEIIWMGGMSAVNISFNWLGFEFWDYFQVGIGIILGFFSGGIALVSGFLAELMR